MEMENKKNREAKTDWSSQINQLKKLLIRRPEIIAGFALLVVVVSYLSLSSPEDHESSVLSVDSSSDHLIDLPVPGIQTDAPAAKISQFRELNEPSNRVAENLESPVIEEDVMPEATDTSAPEEEAAGEVAMVSAIDTVSTPVNEAPEKKVVKIKAEPKAIENKTVAPEPKKLAQAEKKKAVDSWVFGKNPDAYTIQLIGSSNEKQIQNFVKSHQQENKLTYFHTIKDNKNWYVVVQGNYKTFSEAEKERKQLAETLAKYGAWTRKYHSIQKEISANAEKILLMSTSFATNE